MLTLSLKQKFENYVEDRVFSKIFRDNIHGWGGVNNTTQTISNAP